MFLSVSTSLSKAAHKYQQVNKHVRGGELPVNDMTPRCFVAALTSTGFAGKTAESSLFGRVPIGSLLLAVNDTSVVKMGKEEIHSFIDSKQAEERVLTFKFHHLQ